MEYQKIINFLDNTPSQPSKFKTKNWRNEERIMKIIKLHFKLQG